MRIEKKAETELTLIRTIAGAARALDEDLKVSPLQAIDRLQKLHSKFEQHWYAPPWLVLEDCYPLPATMPVERMLADIKKHGQPIGIVGVAKLTTKRDTILRMMFRKDDKSRKTVERSADVATKTLEEADKQAEEIKRQELTKLHEGTAQK
jgi:hypothetical protein